MMKCLILVIDDQIKTRRKNYDLLAGQINQSASNIEIIMDYVNHPNELPTKISEKFSGAIVDAVLDEHDDWKNFSITKALKIIGDKIPVALLSTRWDKTNSEELDEAWKKPNCRTFLHWRDIDPNLNGQIDYAIRALSKMIADYQKIDITQKIGPNDPIRILHISDLHAGKAGGNLKLDAYQCAENILGDWDGSPPTFVAFTGDIAEYASPSQYKIARDWLEYFLARVGIQNLPSNNVLYVPGNHDVNLKLAAAARIKLDLENKIIKKQMSLSTTIQQEELISYAYSPFRKFLYEISDCPLLNSNQENNSFAWVESRYRHLGVLFYGINTAQPANAFTFPDRNVEADALAQIAVELKAIIANSQEDSSPLIIGLGHHCPVPASEDSAVTNPEIFDKVFRGSSKTGLFLHGHVHQHDLMYQSNDGVRLVRSCSSTLTKTSKSRPQDSLRGYNLLNIKRQNGEIESLEASAYGWMGTEIKKIKKSEWKFENDGMFKEL